LHGSVPLRRRRFLDRTLFLRECVSLRLVLFLDRRWFGVSLSLRGRRRGKRNKTDQAGKIFQQDFSRMMRGTAKQSGQTKSMAKSQRIKSCSSD
jgi:hypothetical protein